MDEVWVRVLVKIGLVFLLFVLWFGGAWFKYMGVGRRMSKAIECGDVAALRILVQKYRKILVEDDYEVLVSYLSLAVIQNQHECLKELLALGDAAHLQQRAYEEDDSSLLQLCIEHASPEMLRTMLAAGMQPAAEAESPWLYCCVHASVAHARVLREFGGDIITPEQAEEEGGKTPLHAVVYGWFYNPGESAAMVRYLLQECGADPNVMTLAGNTPLDLACDETHVGFEGNDELCRLLTEAGGKRGRYLRVQVPSYTGRVLVTGALPDVAALVPALPEGVSLTPHHTPWDSVALDAALNNGSYQDEFVAHVRNHTSHVLVTVQGQDGEDPVAVAQRAIEVLHLLQTIPGTVGVQFQSYIGSALQGESGSLFPYNLVGIELGRTVDDDYLLATRGMVDYGLAEVEVEMPALLIEEKKLSPFAPLGDVLIQLMRGTSSIEPGHTLTLCGYFSRADWGCLGTTGVTGLRIEMTTSDKPDFELEDDE